MCVSVTEGSILLKAHEILIATASVDTALLLFFSAAHAACAACLNPKP